MMKIDRILVTGGTGFFGRALLRHWSALEYSGIDPPLVTVLTRNVTLFKKHHPEFAVKRWLTFIEGDILEADSLPEITFSHVLHAAAESTVGPLLSPIHRYDQIVSGTRNILEWAHRRQVKRFLFTSSGGIYGTQPKNVSHIPETYLGAPNPLVLDNAYSIAKRTAEHLCTLLKEASSTEHVIARCFAFVGPDLPFNAHFAIGNFIRDALNNLPITIKGDGATIRSYLDQRDLAIWLLEMLQSGGDGEVYNLGSDEEISIIDLANLVKKTVNPNVDINIVGSERNHGYRARYVPNVSKARNDLSLEIRYSLTDAILNAADGNK
jgi:dTDP-glucose 4,6-dehydratase